MHEKSARLLIVDTETTGLNPHQGDRLIEFAALEMVNRCFTGKSLHLYIDPERSIPVEAVAIHGITAETLKAENALPFAQVARQIADFIRGAELIIHNAPFDLSFLNMEFARVKQKPVEEICTVTDSLVMARELYPGQKNSLDALCGRLGVDRSARVLHGALIDCRLLGEVYLAMTHRQFSLDIESEEKPVVEEVAAVEDEVVEICAQNLRVIRADDAETAAHDAYLERLQQETGKPPLFSAPR